MATLHMRLRPHTCTHVIPEKHLKEGTGFLFLDPPAVELTSCSWVEPPVMHLIMNLLLHHEPRHQLHILICMCSFIYTYEQLSWKPKNCTTNLVPPTKINLHFFSTYFSTLCVCIFTLIGHSVQFSCSEVSNSLRPYGLQHSRLPCPSPAPRVYSNSCPLSQWCHPTISASCLQSFPASGSFEMSQLFSSGGQSMGVLASASVLPKNT